MCFCLKALRRLAIATRTVNWLSDRLDITILAKYSHDDATSVGKIMIRTLTKLALALAVIMAPQSAVAQTFSCASYNGAPYCSYVGKVQKAYINEGNVLLFYFEESIDLSVVSASGYTGSPSTVAAAYLTTTNPVFAEYLYSTMLTALAADKVVTIQMSGLEGGYLRINRIWIHK